MHKADRAGDQDYWFVETTAVSITRPCSALYWQFARFEIDVVPELAVKASSTRPADLSFYTSDMPGDYRIVVEGY